MSKKAVVVIALVLALTTTALIGIGGSLAKVGAGAKKAPRMSKHKVTSATLFRMSHSTEVRAVTPSVRGEAGHGTGARIRRSKYDIEPAYGIQ